MIKRLPGDATVNYVKWDAETKYRVTGKRDPMENAIRIRDLILDYIDAHGQDEPYKYCDFEKIEGLDCTPAQLKKVLRRMVKFGNLILEKKTYYLPWQQPPSYKPVRVKSHAWMKRNGYVD